MSGNVGAIWRLKADGLEDVELERGEAFPEGDLGGGAERLKP